ncbi:MAG: hypothetical protein IPL78_26850 [Chloroflexi bacterium]|nr:hypothetical protein [Chloroflexota bacterium]
MGESTQSTKAHLSTPTYHFKLRIVGASEGQLARWNACAIIPRLFWPIFHNE